MDVITDIEVAHGADKAGAGAMSAFDKTGLNMRQFLPWVKSLAAQQGSHAQPPVTGGKKAISSPSLMLSSRCA